jgi:hypothetical protein
MSKRKRSNEDEDINKPVKKKQKIDFSVCCEKSMCYKHHIQCKACKKVICPKCRYVCLKCKEVVCSDCKNICERCQQTHSYDNIKDTSRCCESCKVYCYFCKEVLCKDHLRICSDCGKTLCEYGVRKRQRGHTYECDCDKCLDRCSYYCYECDLILCKECNKK